MQIQIERMNLENLKSLPIRLTSFKGTYEEKVKDIIFQAELSFKRRAAQAGARGCILGVTCPQRLPHAQPSTGTRE